MTRGGWAPFPPLQESGGHGQGGGEGGTTCHWVGRVAAGRTEKCQDHDRTLVVC